MNMNNELIQWPSAQYWDKPWNPYIGCIPISPGCENCYACRMWKRFGKSFTPRLSCKQRPPRNAVIFCGNMTDLFADFVGMDKNYQLFRSCLKVGYRHEVFLWLTKRPRNMCSFLLDLQESITDWEKKYDPGFHEIIELLGGHDDLTLKEKVRDHLMHQTYNHYFGFTAENQQWYDRRFDLWGEYKPDAVKGWLSAEPLLGPIDLGLTHIAPEDMPFKWIVVGCESGPKRRPCQIQWVENIVEQAMEYDIPVFVKQLDINGKCETDITKFPKHLQIRQVPWGEIMAED